MKILHPSRNRKGLNLVPTRKRENSVRIKGGASKEEWKGKLSISGQVHGGQLGWNQRVCGEQVASCMESMENGRDGERGFEVVLLHNIVSSTSPPVPRSFWRSQMKMMLLKMQWAPGSSVLFGKSLQNDYSLKKNFLITYSIPRVLSDPFILSCGTQTAT